MCMGNPQGEEGVGHVVRQAVQWQTALSVPWQPICADTLSSVHLRFWAMQGTANVLFGPCGAPDKSVTGKFGKTLTISLHLQVAEFLRKILG